jgi:hypothetical protein
MSRGAIQRTVDRVSAAIKPHYEVIAEKARSAPVNDIDETAWYQHGMLAWLWAMGQYDRRLLHRASELQQGGVCGADRALRGDPGE